MKARTCGACATICDLPPGEVWTCPVCSKAHQGPRLDLIAHLREQIASGRYLTEKRLELTVKIVIENLGRSTAQEQE